jgi:hypothetical protein
MVHGETLSKGEVRRKIDFDACRRWTGAANILKLLPLAAA